MDSFPTGQLTKGYRPDPQIYIQLIQECENQRKEGEFSPCFTELQRDFLKNRPPKLKSLIRLVKHWYQLVWRSHLGREPRRRRRRRGRERVRTGEEGGRCGGREGAGRGVGRRRKRRRRRGGIRKDAGGRREPDGDEWRGGKGSLEGDYEKKNMEE